MEENAYSWENPEYRKTYHHTCSHVMAQAICRLYPGTKLAIGPAIEEGFYYDIDSEHTFSPDDFEAIEKEMRKICKEKLKLERFELPRAEAVALMEKAEQPYKVELINDLSEDAVISFYRQGEFTDLCAGPHLDSTGRIKGNGIKLTNVTGAYWRGDSKRKMLQRIYGRELPEQGRCWTSISPASKKPRSATTASSARSSACSRSWTKAPASRSSCRRAWCCATRCIDYWRQVHKRYGYVEISTPMILNRALWERSGHWDHYKQNMYTTVIDGEDYAIKPMNCPGGMLVYKSRAALLPRSAAARGRAGPGPPPRAVRRAARPLPRALLHAGRRAHLHDLGADEGRDQERRPPVRRGLLRVRPALRRSSFPRCPRITWAT